MNNWKGFALLLVLLAATIGGGAAPDATYRTRLLADAFDAASLLPPNPHIKNRSRAQYTVVETSIDLGLLSLAESLCLKIDHWERCMGLLDLADYHVSRGAAASATPFLKCATEMIRMADDREQGRVVAMTADPVLDNLTGWRLERAKSRMLQVQLALNQPSEEILSFSSPLQPDKAAPVWTDAILAQRQLDLDGRLDALALVATNQNFEIVQEAMRGYAQLLDTNYGNPRIRQEITGRLESQLDQRLPLVVKVEKLGEWSAIALRHADKGQAVEWIDRANGLLDGVGSADVVLEPRSRLIVQRKEAGDAERAGGELDAAISFYAQQRDRIVNIERAKLLCALAEASMALGRTGEAATLYLRAMDEGLENPNGRPRVVDYCTISCSLARQPEAPGDDVVKKLGFMRNALGSPW